MTKVFIDGSAGTTGLRIRDRLAARGDIALIELPDEKRKDPAARADALTRADVAFLCLPDDAAREAVSLVGDALTVVIDTSTAHRIAPGWAYGFAEIGGRREEIAHAKRIANPGCHASGFLSLVAPLVSAGLLSKGAALSCFSLTGYSGGGKKMIAQYEDSGRDKLLAAPRMYGLTQAHKHLPEMKAICNLDTDPVFCPIVAPYYSGMQVTVPIFKEMVQIDINDIEFAYKQYYQGTVVRYSKKTDQEGFISAALFEGRDDMAISVFGNNDRILLVSSFDNLGKGASGAAIQNMNLVLGTDETEGLVIGG